MRDTIRWLICFACMTFCLPSSALADGKIFSGRAKVNIPDQQALIAWQEGKQVLAIETGFEGAGKEFAWIVPLPSRPEISEVRLGAFPTLHALFLPQVVAHDSKAWLVGFFIWFRIFPLLLKKRLSLAYPLVFTVTLACLTAIFYKTHFPATHPERNRYYSAPPDMFPVCHPELKRLVGTAPVASRLTAVLKPEEMQRDLYLSGSPSRVGSRWSTAGKRPSERG